MLISPNFSRSSVLLTNDKYATRKRLNFDIWTQVVMLANYCLCCQQKTWRDLYIFFLSGSSIWNLCFKWTLEWWSLLQIFKIKMRPSVNGINLNYRPLRSRICKLPLLMPYYNICFQVLYPFNSVVCIMILKKTVVCCSCIPNCSASWFLY